MDSCGYIVNLSLDLYDFTEAIMDIMDICGGHTWTYVEVINTSWGGRVPLVASLGCSSQYVGAGPLRGSEQYMIYTNLYIGYKAQPMHYGAAVK